MTGDGCQIGVECTGAFDLDRFTALTEVIDWAETEAAALNAPDVGMCLQLARLALLARTERAS